MAPPANLPRIMLLNSASEEKSEGEGHSAMLKCESNNVYKFGDLLPYCRTHREHSMIITIGRPGNITEQIGSMISFLKLAFMRPIGGYDGHHVEHFRCMASWPE